MILALVALSLAADPPLDPGPRPVPADTPAGCPESVGVRAGVPLTPACNGVLLSMERAKWLGDMSAWADLADADRRLTVAELAAAHDREDYWRTLAQRPAPRPVPPVVYVGGGIVGGVVLAVVTEWAVLRVGER